MNQVYEPLKDAAADGFVDLSSSPTKAEWKATSQSALGMANDAPDATETEKKSFWTAFRVCVALVLVFAVFWACKVHFTKKYEDHEARVGQINAPASGSPEVGASSVNKNAKNLTKPNSKESATKKIVDEALNTLPSNGFYGLKPHEKPPDKQSKKPKIKDDFTAEFDREQIKFETNLKKEFP